ncbi:hypothetical protein HBI56_154970 [Parastagonospora nodorum]|uniref:Uncharacterized protein n=1 Tax=Phaeosphaeria nodorum (strain SN15 / ATCC MYA-4574 / FGSC 10173) TaxID=321614 RepID=A0A7U2FIT8_PHANO|nr:hypothetical protein HBH56_117650 [Parastagonospora nodorum]QRD05214.1 hypothetical protein JI435_307510 [Parastagonospora nodorum SN15]KAH3929140.1 hypothetical protein HBH54_131560 [Parastagonospora nodorum]KAH3950545.1 hypothetical protein HBH53_071830 [Parastagonospora nodorum]KAH3959890.1 hypothetical protein HBH51_196080 [Parastagonospora nodorum]
MGLQQHTHELESCMRRKPTAGPEVRVAHAKTALHARKEARLRGAGKGVGALEPWMIRRANRDGSAAQRLLTSCSDRTWCLFSGAFCLQETGVDDQGRQPMPQFFSALSSVLYLFAPAEQREASFTLAGMAAEDRPQCVPLAASSPLPKSIHVEPIGWKASRTRRQVWRNSFGKIQGQGQTVCCIPSPLLGLHDRRQSSSDCCGWSEVGGRPPVRSGG